MKLKPAILIIGTALVVMWMAFISISLVRAMSRIGRIERTVISISLDTGDISDIKDTVEGIKSSTDTIESWVEAH